MLLGADVILSRMTKADEYGIYRQYRIEAENVQLFLLFACTTKTEALTIAAGVAGVLGIPFRNEISSSVPDTKTPLRDGLGAGLTQTVSGAPKQKVSGVGAQIRMCLAQGLIDSDIVEKLIPMYTTAGKTETVARNLLKPYVAELRKLEAKKRSQYKTVLGVQ